MRAIIAAKFLLNREAKPAKKPFEIYDTRPPGFTLRVQPSGTRAYYARLGRSRRFWLGKVGALSPEEGRDKWQKVLGNLAHGRHPLQSLDGTAPTLGKFIDRTYAPWVRANGLGPERTHSRNCTGCLGPGIPSRSRRSRSTGSRRGRFGGSIVAARRRRGCEISSRSGAFSPVL